MQYTESRRFWSGKHNAELRVHVMHTRSEELNPYERAWSGEWELGRNPGERQRSTLDEKLLDYTLNDKQKKGKFQS